MTEIRLMRDGETGVWAALRSKLWPDCGPEDNDADIAAYRAGGPVKIVLLAFDDGKPVGFAEISERSVAGGCGNDPVAYVEGWYVDADCRGRGVGGALIARAAEWARAQGYAWLGSDAELDNTGSHKAHAALGFEETGRVVNYRMEL